MAQKILTLSPEILALNSPTHLHRKINNQPHSLNAHIDLWKDAVDHT